MVFVDSTLNPLRPLRTVRDFILTSYLPRLVERDMCDGGGVSLDVFLYKGQFVVLRDTAKPPTFLRSPHHLTLHQENPSLSK